MQQQDLITLLTELKGSLSTDAATDETGILQQSLAPVLTSNLQTTVVAPPPPTPVTPVVTSVAEVPKLYTKVLQNAQLSLPVSNQLLQQSPAVFTALKAGVAPEKIAPVAISKGAGILNTINLQEISSTLKQWFTGLHFTEFISVFLSTDTVNPVLMLPITINLIPILRLPHTNPSYTIAKGSVWIRSQLLCSTAPANTYTGLTISGGTLSFNQSVSINNKDIIMPAGTLCTVQLNLEQPVDSTVSPDNIGIDAMNAQAKMPTSLSFNFTGPTATITAAADASWNLYGSTNTFQFDTAQTAVYNPVLNSILVGFKVSAPTFAVSKCQSPMFTIQGEASILKGYWELPVATINITTTNTATGTGALAVICSGGLQVNWNGLSGGLSDLRLPLLSATTGIIGVADAFAGNVYGTQNYDLWANETTGLPSTLAINYTELFTVYYVSIQDGSELLATDANFNAQIDRPLRVDGSPVEVKGKNALLYQYWTPAEKLSFCWMVI